MFQVSGLKGVHFQFIFVLGSFLLLLNTLVHESSYIDLGGFDQDQLMASLGTHLTFLLLGLNT